MSDDKFHGRGRQPCGAMLRTAASPRQNFISLFKRQPQSHDVIYGLKAVALLWSVLFTVRQQLFRLVNDEQSSVTATLGHWVRWKDAWSEHVFDTGDLAVDLMLMLSAYLCFNLLVRRSALSTGEAPQRVGAGLFYFTRMLRLVPTYVVTMLGIWLFWGYAVSREHCFYCSQSARACETSFWAVQLFAHNIFTLHSPFEGCFSWMWPLALLAQCWVFTPPLVAAYKYSRALGVYTVSVCLIIASMVRFALLLALGCGTQWCAEYYSAIYMAPWARIGPYLVGLLLAMALEHCQEQYVAHTRRRLLWLIGVCVMSTGAVVLALAYGSVPFNVFTHNSTWPTVGGAGAHMPKAISLLMATLNRTVFAAGVAGWLFLCITGFGSGVNWLLGGAAGGNALSVMWRVVSRLALCAYTVHVPVVVALVESAGTEGVSFNSAYAMYLWLQAVLLSLLIALPLYLTVDAPLHNVLRPSALDHISRYVDMKHKLKNSKVSRWFKARKRRLKARRASRARELGMQEFE